VDALHDLKVGVHSYFPTPAKRQAALGLLAEFETLFVMERDGIIDWDTIGTPEQRAIDERIAKYKAVLSGK
jgi:hypothetical protein